jgi:5-(carboxyamino)imidazole ribonucleotide synthase
MEVSVTAARGIAGNKVVYPVGLNVHKDSILETTVVPAALSPGLEAEIHAAAGKVMDAFDGVGTFCVEMFVCGERVLVNEVAPRPHNSGHYTIEGCRVNQFENHIRAITGLPLGSTGLLHGAVLMRNLLGQSDGPPLVHGLAEAYAHEGINVHIYGKTASKTGRKMGHYTITADSPGSAWALDGKVKDLVRITGGGQ